MGRSGIGLTIASIIVISTTINALALDEDISDLRELCYAEKRPC